MNQIIYRLLILSFYISMACAGAKAQTGNVWVFGKNGGLDFNSGNPVPIRTSMDGFGEASASVCDDNGRLIFYTEGSKVWGSDGNLIFNGTDLTGEVSVNSFTPTSSTCQGTLIVPFVNNPNCYFIFSLTSYEQKQYGKLFYSIVDMRLNNGKGAVVDNQKGILIDSNLTEQMTAVVGDRCNIWLLVCNRKPKHNIKAYEISEQGIAPSPVISDGIPSYYEHQVGGTFAVAFNRKQIALTKNSGSGTGVDGLALFDFDPGTGILRNYRQLSSTEHGAGVSFSPDGTKLYFESFKGIYQYDLSLADLSQIIGSRVLLHTNPGMVRGTFKLAPDDKIYFRGIEVANGAVGSSTLSRISAPNQPGVLCQYEENAIALLLPTYIYLGLPTELPILKKDTFLTSKTFSGVCFANVNPLRLTAGEPEKGWDYQWNTGATTSTISADTPGKYWISYRTPPCNFHTDTFYVSFPNGVLPTVTIDTACAGTANGKAYAATYPGDTVRYTYTWRNALGSIASTSDTLAAVAAGRYSLRVQTQSCDTTIYITIPEVAYNVSFAVDTVLCQTQSFTVLNTSAPHFLRYQWDFGNGHLDTTFQPQYAYPHPGQYKVLLYARGQYCTDSFRVLVEVDTQFVATFASHPDTICMGDAITFTPTQHESIQRYQWLLGDGNNMNTESGYSFSHGYDSPGAGRVTMQSLYRACPATVSSHTIFVRRPPQVDLGSDTAICLQGQPILLVPDLRTEDYGVSYLWSTGDTSRSVWLRAPGTYMLTLRDYFGCQSTEWMQVKKDCYIERPNAFTPNGDGFNDYFFPRQNLSRGIASLHFRILNRWGQIVFESKATEGRGWDGRNNGQEQDAGVYIYTMEASYIDGRKENYSGNVSLLR